MIILGAAAAFGLVCAWAKGPGSDGLSGLAQARSAIGNLSTPWLLVAFVPGAACVRIRAAALLGLLSTLVALTAFYVLTTQLVDLGGHGFVADLRLELAANRGYFEGGILSGLAFGALGGWWGRTRSMRASVVVGALLVAEPVVLAVLGLAFRGGALTSPGAPMLVRLVPGWGLSSSSGPISLTVYAAELAAGLAVLAIAWRLPPRRALRA